MSADPLWPPRLSDLLAPWRGAAGHATAPGPVALGYVPQEAARPR
ncbi:MULTISPECIES: hypothetical protein [Streptomyces]|nr:MULTISPECIES: hypothetical protein [unclassified Streptomyces]